uniref:ATP synthase F0 subunit 8 n=1 Tax=Cumberlandia monodonta TaxID=52365 RepID=A0A1X9JIC2_CUMMO|nr:ATP synthase F0 subunit 8 [Cumberlandia monodonta]
MPQFSPMSWSVISLLVACHFLVICVVLWWLGAGGYFVSFFGEGEVMLPLREFGFNVC